MLYGRRGNIHMYLNKNVVSFQNAFILGIIVIGIYGLALILLQNEITYSTIFSDIITPSLNIIAVILLFYAAKHSKAYGRRIYMAWIFLAIAQLSFFMGDVLWGFIELVLNQQPSASIADVFYLIYYPLFAIGITILSSSTFTRIKQFKMSIDMGIVIISVALIFLTLLIIPIFETMEVNSIEVVISILYVLLDFLLFIALLNLIFRLFNKSGQTALLLLAVAVLFQILADFLYINFTVYGEYVSGSFIDVGWVIGYVFTSLAAISQIKNKEIDFNRYFPHIIDYCVKFKYKSYIPPIFAAMSYIILIWAYRNLSVAYIHLLELGVGAIIFLVIVRQITALIENKKLFTASRDEIYKRKKIELALKESEKKYRQIVENADEGILSTNNAGEIVFINPQVETMLGYQEKELIGRHVFSLMDQNSANIAKNCLVSVKEGNNGEHELKLIKKSGNTIYAYFKVSPIMDNGNYNGCLALILDITERKKAEKEIENSLIEKETLLREIHHRVKNNMQIISSLLSLQSRYITDEEAMEIFQEGQNRVRSMALVHEKLYKSENLSKINIQDYIKDMISYLSRSYPLDYNLIKFKVNVQDIPLNIDTAVPLGLIMTEIITNSLKYAFPVVNYSEPANGSSKRQEVNGEIEVKLERKNKKYLMTISDNGIGIPKDIDIQKIDTLGLKLVNILVDQLDGKLELLNGNGTTFKIDFMEINN